MMSESMHQAPVAFFAYLSYDFTTSFSQQTLVFDNVVTDMGGGLQPGNRRVYRPGRRIIRILNFCHGSPFHVDDRRSI
ncbi:hypothetical protein MAR_033876 [Mya arenaria]|uniref:Uncharacterized protein n=1 Tax=Mya arenaria TaxID=6604 RepID=A0ABY7GCR2_MYAAR|nr:hypothetical protein MAR_033876 [Mya arenaria]